MDVMKIDIDTYQDMKKVNPVAWNDAKKGMEQTIESGAKIEVSQAGELVNTITTAEGLERFFNLF